MATSFNTKDILARLKEKRALAEQAAANKVVIPTIHIEQTAPAVLEAVAELVEVPKVDLGTIYDRYGKAITLNQKQNDFVVSVASGISTVMIGAAGTGKTTSTNAGVQALIQKGMVPPLPHGHGHKHLQTGAPGIAICAYTRRATNNIKANQSDDVKPCCLTIHKLLCFEPVVTEVTDEATGISKASRRFEPRYNAENPLPSHIKVIIIEEASMVGMELWDMLMAAIKHEVQFIFLGDLNQLPPVFGPAILGFKLNELSVIELTDVYRQALDSPIISLAHRILSAIEIHVDELKDSWAKKPGLKIVPWQKKIAAENATTVLSQFVVKALETGEYDPTNDGILIPFNKACGTLELNNHIANAVAKKEQKPVYEIIHKYFRSYYSVGDKCLYEKEDAVILSIEPNPLYSGAIPYREPSVTLDYWGNDTAEDSKQHDSVDDILSSVGVGTGDDEEGKLAASHIIRLHLLDSDREVIIDSAGQVSALILGYAITVHKAQGSEWEKVFLFFHHSHANMIQRELLYTAVTRAKKDLIIVCEPDTFVKGIKNAKIKGKTLKEKAEWFKGKQDQRDKDARSDNMD